MSQPAQTHKKSSASLFVLAFIMVVNALAYGSIIPLLYPYAQRFGINPLGLSFMFASFSIAQFLATPIIGRLSDRYGRKPLLVFSILGTSLSLAMFASATTVPLLFLARIIDGITGGNISVAQAVIADSTKGEDRAKGFGVLGAAFGFGFLAGPAMGALLSQVNLTAPFWFASILALAATILAMIFLKETLPPEARKAKHLHEPLFRFSNLYHALFSPTIGIVLVISFVTSVALNAFIIGYQSFTVDILKLDAQRTAMIFGLFGLISVVMQMAGLRGLLKVISSKKQILIWSLFLSTIFLVLTAFTAGFVPFVIAIVLFGIVSSPQNPMVTALLSERTNVEDQGIALGINQSYVSLGQIVGPIAAGVIATSISVPSAFLLAAGLSGLAAIIGLRLYAPVKAKADL